MKFREKSINKLYAFALAAVFAIALAGCGGGGGTAEEPPPPMPTPQETCEAAGNQYVNGECLTPAQVTINAALAKIAAATTAEEAQAAYDEVKDDVTATAGERLQAAVDARVAALAKMARADTQKMALAAAAGMIDTSDLSTQEMVDAARTAIAGLRGALDDADDVSDEDKEMYQTQLDDAVTAVDDAQDGIDTATRRTNQMTALSNASTALQAALAALAGSTPTQAQLDAANNALTALNTAIADGADLTAAEKAPYQREADNAAAPINTAQTAFDEDEDEDAKATAKANAQLGKDLRAALGGPEAGGNALANIDAATTPVALAASGLTIDAAEGAGSLGATDDPGIVELKAGDSAGALGSWNGMDYAHTNTGTKVVNEARVYTNKGAGKTVTFAAAGYTVATATSGADLKGYLTLDATDADTLGRIMAATFTHSGTQTHQIPDRSDALYVRGTYDGAPGQYRCTGPCSSTNDGKGSPSALGGTTWHFKPDAGAMVMQPDANYLYYGWWVSKDKDGKPTAASAFAGIVGDVDGNQAAVDRATLTGSATYVGKAAGKFAMSNVLDGTGSGGHFTADATLTAKFGAIAADNQNGVTGTINNFRLNDGSEDPGWSVSLNRSSAWGADGAITGPTADATVWSINGNKAPASGAWSGTMYDEMPGDAPSGDGSNIPTTVTGTFYSEFDTIGRMVGAFGADKQ